MKVLLIAVNAKFSHTNPAVRSIAAYLNQHGHTADFMEFTINMDLAALVRTIAHYSSVEEKLLVLFSTYIWNVAEIRAMISDLKKVRPQWLYGMGGPEVSFDSVTVLEELPAADFILSGEGEALAVELVDVLKTGGDLSGVCGLTYRTSIGHVCGNEKRILIERLDDLPFVYGFDEDLEHRIIYYESSRGCPFSCSYCLSSTTDGVRYLPLERVCKDLKVFLDARAMQVKFVDRTFNADRGRALAIMKYLAENDNGFTNFHFEMTASMLDEATLDFVRTVRPALFQFEIGVQTTHRETGSAIERHMPFERIRANCLEILKAGNVHLHLDLIAGLPYETFERFKQSMDDVMAIRPHMLQLGFLKLLKGSRVRREAELHDYAYTDRAPYEVLSNRYISYDQMMRLKEMEDLLEGYFNSGLLRKTTLLTAEAFFSGSYADFLENFAAYWSEYGLFLKNHKKEGLIAIFVEYLNWLEHIGVKDADKASLAELAWLEGVRFGLRGLAEKIRPEGQLIKDRLHNYFKDEQNVAAFNVDWVGRAARDLVKQVVVVSTKLNAECLFAVNAETATESWTQRLISSQSGKAALYVFNYSARNPVTGCHDFRKIEQE